MKSPQIRKVAGGAVLTLGVIALSGWLSIPTDVHAQDKEQDSQRCIRESRIKTGFEVAPVPLNLVGKDHDLVGLGSYWVNVIASCDDCHTAGGSPNFNYAAGGNPYFGQHKKIDPNTYLAGGTDFGPALPPGFYAPGYGSYLGPDIVSRNLTPDKTGLPVGGHTFEQFLEIMRTGVDLDQQHPTCTTVSPNPSPANCLPPPNDGSRLQIMPWPSYKDMTEHDLRAIYEYLSAIPCIAGPPAPSFLHNDCGDDASVRQDDSAAAATARRTKKQ